MRLTDNEWRSLSKALGFPVRISYKDLQNLNRTQEQQLLGWFYLNVELPSHDL